MDSAALPTLDGKYELVRKLGEGGMGAVYEGRHRGTGRRVAVKVISSELVKKNAEVLARFQREALASGAIESQYIAQVFDTGVDAASGSPYLVMELLTGGDLEQTIDELGPLPPDVALRIVAQACLGLMKAHEAGIIHRDIKPANIFLARRDGGEVVVKILDFGIAKAQLDPLTTGEHSTTQTGATLGSPAYMSPEQATGRKSIDHRTDIWSLGVVLYQALCGQTPHSQSASVGELLIRVCGQPAPHLQERARWVPSGAVAIVHRALALDPSARFASVAELYAAIRALLPGGHALDQSMIVGVSSAQRAVVAPRCSLAPDVRAPLPSFHSSPDLDLLAQARISAAALHGATTAGFTRSSAATPNRSRSLLVVLGIAGLLVGGAIAAFLRSPPAGSTAGAAPATSAPAENAPTPTEPPAAAPTETAAATATAPSETSTVAAPSDRPSASPQSPSEKTAPTSKHGSAAPAQAAPATSAGGGHPKRAAPAAAGGSYNPLEHL